MRIVREDETRDARLAALNKQLEGFHIAYDALLVAAEHLRPFYPQTIYDGLRRCLAIANREDVHLKLAGPDTFTMAWSKEGERNVEEFSAVYNAVTDMIRDRISKLAILPAT